MQPEKGVFLLFPILDRERFLPLTGGILKTMNTLSDPKPVLHEDPTSEELGRVFRHLKELTPPRAKHAPRHAEFLRQVRFRFGASRPGEDAWLRLHDLLVHGTTKQWRERVLACWASGRATLTQSEKQVAARNLSVLVRGGVGGVNAPFEGAFVTGVLSTLVWFFGSVFLCMVAFFAGAIIGERAWHPPYSSFTARLVELLYLSSGGFLLNAFFAPFYGVYSIVRNERHNREIREEAARALGRLGATEGVSALLSASQNRDFFVNVGREALIRTLPSLTHAHYGTLDTDAVPNLCRLFLADAPALTTEGIALEGLLLDALEKVGNAGAIKPLERFVDSPVTRALRNTERAEAVLEVIRERILRETEKATLLRGSEAPVLPQTLLRPVVNRPEETGTVQLLRPTSRDD